MLEGKRVNLRIAERNDIPLLIQWLNDAEFAGDYQHFPIQVSDAQLEKQVLEQKLYGQEWVDYIVEKKDGTRIGWVAHYISAPNFGWTEIGYAIVADERKKGYGTEAVQILVDYLFLTREIVRIQAVVNVEDAASQRALEKTGFRKEGTLRKSLWDSKGRWADGCLYSILRDEWRQPKTLTKPFRQGKREK